MANTEIHGECDRKFQKVRDAFGQNFADGFEIGAAVAVTLDGKPVVDLWGGHADAARTRPWQADTIVNVWSTTKGMTATCAHRLAGEGRLDFDAPVARYWPEFAQAGKAELPVRYLLNHQAGMAAVRAPLQEAAIFDWNRMTSELARQEPWWRPGTGHGYHAFTFGWLVGEVVRRISGKSLGSYFRDEIAGPLGADFHIGFGPELDARVAETVFAPPPKPGEVNPMANLMQDPASVSAHALSNPPNLLTPQTTNSRQWRGAEIPGANGHANARGIARIYGALARGGEIGGLRVMAQKEISNCHIEQSNGPDLVLQIPTRFSLGYMMSLPGAMLGPNPHSFGHPGAGGSLGFADPDTKVGFGYVMNQMGGGILIDPRVKALVDAVYASL